MKRFIMVALPWFVLVAAGVAIGYLFGSDSAQQTIDMLLGVGRDINGF